MALEAVATTVSSCHLSPIRGAFLKAANPDKSVPLLKGFQSGQAGSSDISRRWVTAGWKVVSGTALVCYRGDAMDRQFCLGTSNNPRISKKCWAT